MVYSWGTNDNDQLGLNNEQNHRKTPKIIKHLRHISITNISCSGYHTILTSMVHVMYGVIIQMVD